MTPRILIIEDDNEINQLLKMILQQEGYDVLQAYSGTEALLRMEQVEATADLILLDLMIPGMSGEELLHHLRNTRQSTLPVLVLSAKNALEDKVSLLRLGADDYISKPFEPEEVVARVQAALRRSNFAIQQENRQLVYKNIVLEPHLRKVTVCQKELSLTALEYEILHLLIQNPEKVYTRQALYEEVWKDGYYGTDHTVNVHVSNLRKKIKEQDPEESYIQSVYGIGIKKKKS